MIAKELTIFLFLLHLAQGRDSPLFIDRDHHIGQIYLSSVVAGDYLYWYGGQIYYTNGTGLVQYYLCDDTYSIDLASNWTNSTVSVNQLDINAMIPDLNSPLLWKVDTESAFYSYNGFVSWEAESLNLPDNDMFEFTPDGAGNGTWSRATAFRTADSNFSALARVAYSASACGADTCYAIGGKQDSRTTHNAPDSGIPASGIVSYNFTSDTWHNDTLSDKMFNGCWENGQLFYTDIAGDMGLLIAMGGLLFLPSNLTNLQGFVAYEHIYLYDIVTKEWYEQRTTGEIPQWRAYPCAVSIQGDEAVNKTIEIFLYGGEDTSLNYDAQKDFADVWVLSLPAFQWHRAGTVSTKGRAIGTCSVAGNRQMVVVGGMDPLSIYNDTNLVIDRSLGLSVFDLSDMVWKDHFSANAPAYESPKVVKSWYAENGYVPQNISDDVRNLFVKPTTTTTNTTGASPTNSSSSSPPSSISSSPEGNKTNVGAIAGGVVGGVVFVVAILVGFYLFRRRQRSQRQVASQNMTQVNEVNIWEAGGREIGEYEADISPPYEADGRLVGKGLA